MGIFCNCLKVRGVLFGFWEGGSVRQDVTTRAALDRAVNTRGRHLHPYPITSAWLGVRLKDQVSEVSDEIRLPDGKTVGSRIKCWCLAFWV